MRLFIPFSIQKQEPIWYKYLVPNIRLKMLHLLLIWRGIL